MPESTWNEDVTGEAEQDVLSVLGDTRSRKIITAAAGSSCTVDEISSDCDMPKSTVYRRVNELVEAGHLDEELRVRGDGQHPQEYSLSPDIRDVEVDLSNQLKVKIWFDGPSNQTSEKPP